MMRRIGHDILVRRAALSAFALSATLTALHVPSALAQNGRDSADVSPSDAPNLEAYLRAHGLEELVVAHLEQQLKQALGNDRIPIAERLAVLYGEMLDKARSDDERDEWDRKSRDLLEVVPAANTQALTINIYKASYLRAQETAERYRLRAGSDDAEVLEARRIMSEVANSLSDLHRELGARIKRLEDQEVTDPTSRRAKQTNEELRELDRLSSQAAYFSGWASYYAAWMVGTNSGVPRAITMFGEILQSERPVPLLDEIPEDLLSYDHIARAVIGVGLCHSLSGRGALGLEWLDHVENSDAPQEIRDQIPAYRLVIWFENQMWDAVDRQVRLDLQTDGMPTTSVRLMAVLSLEELQRSATPKAREFAVRALGILSAQGELGQIRDLARHFDLNSLGNDSFALAYVQALESHEIARSTHGSDEPTSNPQLLKLYQAAESLFVEALSRSDATEFPEARANAMLLRAWILYLTERYEEAASEFVLASPDLPPDASEEALWMQIVALDRWARLTDSPTAASRLRKAMQTFVNEYPSSQYAGRVQFRIAVGQEGPPSLERVEQLLSIPPSSDAFATAQNEAERMLYILFRQSRGMKKISLGEQYLELSMPLLTADYRRAFGSRIDEQARDQYLLRARRVFDALLTRGIARVRDARHLMDRMETARAAGMLDLGDVDNEIEYRRFQIDLLSGDSASAESRCASLWSSPDSETLAMAASQELFNHLVEVWRAFPDDPKVQTTLEQIRFHGQRVMTQFGDPPNLSVAGAAAILTQLAMASKALSDRTDDAAIRQEAAVAFAQLLEYQPRNFEFLKGSAELAETSGAADVALEHWRAAMSGLDELSTQWFESKYHVIRLLGELDFEHALEVMKQHELLHPGYGPAPWGDRLAALANELITQAAEHGNEPETIPAQDPDGEPVEDEG